MKHMESVWPLFAVVALSALMSLWLPGCATSGGQSLMIDTHQVPAVQYMPGEITAMLEDLGYQFIGIHPVTLICLNRVDPAFYGGNYLCPGKCDLGLFQLGCKSILLGLDLIQVRGGCNSLLGKG